MNLSIGRTWWKNRLATLAGGGVLTLGLSGGLPGGLASAQTLPVAGNPVQAVYIDQAQQRATDQRDTAALRQAKARSGLYPPTGGAPAGLAPLSPLAPGVPPVTAATPNGTFPRTDTTATGLGGSLSGTASAAGFGTGLPGGGTSGARFNSTGTSGSSGLGGSGLGVSLAARTPYSTVPPAGAAAGAATQNAIPPMVGTGGVGLGLGGAGGSVPGGFGGSATGLGTSTSGGGGLPSASSVMGGLGQTTIQPGNPAGGVGLGPTSSPMGRLGGSFKSAVGGVSGVGVSTMPSASAGRATTSGVGGTGVGAGGS
jgi:hypothetical protein